LPDADILQRIESLRPWRYQHQVGDITIQSDNLDASVFHESYGKALFAQNVETLLRNRNPEELRALDLGCLEGHYSDVLCAAGFGEVVSVDLSPSHIARAELLLHELRHYSNSTIVEGNVSDSELMASLGAFDIVVCHGLLYHLKDPINLLWSFNSLLSESEHSTILLATQFKSSYSTLISPSPIAELQIKYFPKLDSDSETDYVFSPRGQSAFEPYAFRPNPTLLYQILNKYGYHGLIAYDTPAGFYSSYHINLVVSHSPRPQLLKALQEINAIEGVRYYEWDGGSVNGYSLNRRIFPRALRALFRIVDKRQNRLARSRRENYLQRQWHTGGQVVSDDGE
jgi:2-polyprenyl-3-methyl-5-hydroxy-6-metoxy-1,4-benzoquinol methylase